MNEGVKFTGVISEEELKICKGMPSKERMEKGKVAVIECVQEIPCNPCESACKIGAIHIGKNITSLPTLIQEKCIGCGICIAKCPGLAIIVIDKSHKNHASIEFPFEYLPLPKIGDVVEAVSREGKVVCQGEITSIKSPKFYEKTTVLTMNIPKEYADEVRSIKRLK